MPNYQRCYVPGGLYFFTVVTGYRRPILVDHIDALRGSFRKIRRNHPFQLEAAVILPDHLHCIWRLPPGDDDFSARWRLIKAEFSRSLGAAVPGMQRSNRGERTVWQRRFWEHLIRDDHDYARHVDYIHYNPVRHGYVQRPVDWAYSTFRRFVEKGIYGEDWGAWGVDIELDVE